MKRGLVIGKFYPPHSGHKYLIDTAQAGCDILDVLVVDSPKYRIPAVVRKQWIETLHPKAHVMIIPDIGDDDNSPAWAKYTLQFLGYKPDIVFSSEDYGKPWAHYMHTKHHMVDRQRQKVPISATKVRADMLRYWHYVEDPVRADLALRIVVVGAESTGTTTLAQDLAKHYKAPWAPEYGRLYSEALWQTDFVWTDHDFMHIAKFQQHMEKELAVKSNGFIICDTNATATQLWQDRYLGHISPDVKSIANKDKADLYILTGDEIPFVQDGIRDGEHIRHHMHQDFLSMLQAGETPYIMASGSRQQRLDIVTKEIDKLLKGYTLNGTTTPARTTAGVRSHASATAVAS